MRFSSLFGFNSSPRQPRIVSVPAGGEPQTTSDNHGHPSTNSAAIRPSLDLSGPISPEMTFPGGVWLLPTQRAWATDPWHLRIKEKSRQVGATKTDALDSVLKASPADAPFAVWVTSRDDIQARLYLEDSMDWAKIRDSSPLKIMAKSRQIGISCAGAYHSARIASTKSTISTRNDKSPTAVERAGVRGN